MNKNILCVLLLCLCSGLTFVYAQQTADPYETYTKVGQPIPAFTVTTLDGAKVSSRDLKGKVVVVNLWATWCGPCKEEMPRLEKEIWQKFKASDLAMIAIAREETDKVIAPFRKANAYTFPMAQDPDRKTYKLFASAGIPRTYLVGRDGTILYQSLGYIPADFDKLKALLEAELKKGQK